MFFGGEKRRVIKQLQLGQGIVFFAIEDATSSTMPQHGHDQSYIGILFYTTESIE